MIPRIFIFGYRYYSYGEIILGEFYGIEIILIMVVKYLLVYFMVIE